jgi:hypothetical protein
MFTARCLVFPSCKRSAQLGLINNFYHKKIQMKKTVPALLVCFVLACQSQQQKEASKIMDQVQSTVKKNTPGFIPTSENGYWMKASIDGKEWTATGMFPNDESDSRRIQGENNGEAIGFYLWMRGLENGKHLAFSESNVADLMLNDEIAFWGGSKGEVVITKIDDISIEGSFHFTASSTRSAKTFEVTNGLFHIPLAAAAK